VTVSEPWPVPENWSWAVMGNVAEVVGGGTPSTSNSANFDSGTTPWLTPADLSGYAEKFISSGARFLTAKGLSGSGARIMPTGTVLFTSRAPIGYVAIAANPVATNQGFKSFVLPPELDSSYVYYWLKAARQIVGAMASGTTFPELSGKRAQEVPMPVAPLAEQHRIVAEIEKHLTRLDAAVAALERARAKLKRYRASVLRAAVEGRLVHSDAATWKTMRLGSIAELKGGVTKGQKRKPGALLKSVSYLRVANVQRGFLDLSEVKEIEATPDEIAELRLMPGDVLFNEGGDRDKLGRGWVWQGEISLCIHQNHVFRARIKNEEIEPKFLSWYGNSAGQAYFFAEGKHTTNLASINLTKLSNLPVPIPPHQDQQSIVAEVERRLSVVETLEGAVGASLARADRLRHSVLKRAFIGRLVPQDPNDEPASVLLERIRTERAQAQESPARGPSRPVREARPALL
jgi:type I restriction enzyme S subunit